MFEKTLESPLDCKDVPPVLPKGNQSWIFIGRTDAKAETPVPWPPHTKSWFIGKDSDAGRDWGQEEKGTTEDEMAGWRHRLDGCEFEWTPGIGDGQGGLVCYSSWGCKVSDTTERLNWTELNWVNIKFIDTGGKAEAMVSSCTFMMSYEWLALELSPFEEAMFLHSPDTYWVSTVCRALFSIWEYSNELNGFEISMPYKASFSFTIFSTYDLKSFLQSVNVFPLCVFCWEL